MKKRRYNKRKTVLSPKTQVATKEEVANSADASKESSQQEASKDKQTWENARVRKACRIISEKWKLMGMSVQGAGHIQSNLPCQDYHCIELLDTEKGIGIAVVSDGAGSKANSDKGAEFVCNQTILHLKNAIKELEWNVGNYPDLATWDRICRVIVQLIQNDLFTYAEKTQCSFDSLGATWQMLFFTPEKSYFAHIGDGRACVLAQNGWKSILTPHKGEEANQTVFITNKVLEKGLTISGVTVPETLMIDEPIYAFVLMSDGCEGGLWVKNRKENLPDGDFKYVSLNMPFTPALNDILLKMKICEGAQQKEVFLDILDHYNKPLKNETDDKTICLGYTI